MARKKKQTYSDMVQMMEELQERVITEKDRMAGVLASELDHDTALLLGDLSDTELRRVASFVFAHIGLFVNLAKLDAPKSQQLQAAEDGSAVEGELKYNNAENCWEIWDMETNQVTGRLRDGMRLDLRYSADDTWTPVEIRMMLKDMWYMVENDSPRGIFDGLRVRFHK